MLSLFGVVRDVQVTPSGEVMAPLTFCGSPTATNKLLRDDQQISFQLSMGVVWPVQVEASGDVAARVEVPPCDTAHQSPKSGEYTIACHGFAFGAVLSDHVAPIAMGLKVVATCRAIGRDNAV
jgi:hypothetical protein